MVQLGVSPKCLTRLIRLGGSAYNPLGRSDAQKATRLLRVACTVVLLACILPSMNVIS